MNEFNPFGTLGIDPNTDRQTTKIDNTTESKDVMGTMGQFNPFKELNINVNGFPQPTANGKDTEVQSKLGIDQLTPMTDDEKQSYVDALSDEDWNTWNNLKDEGYSFEARKALLDNRESLYDINKTGTRKYFTEYVPVEDKYDVAQNMINWYQNRAQGFGDRMEENVSEFINYKKDGTERGWYPGKKIANLVNHVVSKGAQIIDDALNIGMQAMEVRSMIDVARGKTDKIVDFDETAENYKSPLASGIGIATGIGEATLGIFAPYAYATFGILGQGDGPVAKVINGLAIPFELGAEGIVDLALSNEQIQEYLNRPENAGAEEELKEGVSLALMALVGKYLKGKNEAWGQTRLGRFYTETKTKVGNAIKKGAEYARGSREMMETDPRFSETSELTKTQNVIKATGRGLKEGWNEEIRLEETPGDNLALREGTKENNKVEIAPSEQERQRQIQQRKTDIINQTKDLKISDESKTNLANNTDLQTEFKNTIKPYLEANGKSNPEGVISEPVNNLVYDIRSGIDELRVQQANLNRSINNKKLTPMEKALIKEIEKIINKKEPQQIYNGLKKLTPQQLGLLERTVPNLGQRIQTIGQMLDLTMEITKNDLVGKFLKFQAERPRRGITGFAKKMLYDFVKDLYEQKGIQSSTESIDRFIDSLSDQQKSDIVETLYKKKTGGEYDNNLLSKMELELYKTQEQKSHEKGYLPETDRRVLNEKGFDLEPDYDPNNKLGIKPVTESLEKNLNRKIPGKNETIGEFYKRKGLEITVFNDLSDMVNSVGGTAQAFFAPYYDRFGALAQTPQVDVLLHEYGHRVLCQLGTFEFMKILQQISKRDGITERAAEERFAEYVRNYFVYGKMDGELQDAFSKKDRKELAVMNTLEKVMEKERKKIFDVFDISKEDAEISDLLYQIKMDTPKIQEINTRQPQHLLDDKGKMSTGLKSKRVPWLQENIDSNIKEILFDKQGQGRIKYKDNTTKTREEFLNGLTEKQKSMVDVYQATPEELKIKEQGFQGEGKFDYETLSNEESSLNINLKNFLERHPEFNKSEFYLNDLDLSEIRKATNELKNIHVNEDGYIVGDYHGHETPVYDYIEDSNLSNDIKEYLKKQETSYLEEQDKGILDKLEELNKKPQTIEELKNKGLNNEQIELLQDLNIASDPLNEYLRTKKLPEAYESLGWDLSDVEDQLNQTIDALNKLDNYEGELRRGGNGKEFGNELKEGQEIENKGLLFSSDEKIENSIYKDSPIYYKINAKGKGTKNSVIQGNKERDFITLPGQKFRVDKITKKDNKTIYELTEI